jgi:hypothetical protein
VIGNKVFNGIGRGPSRVNAGKTAILRTTMPIGLYRRLKRGRVAGTVTFVVTVTSTNGSRKQTNIRTGLTR